MPREEADTSMRGFSLIEVLVATALISTAIVGVAHLAAMGMLQAAAARDGTSALVLAQNKLEELRGATWGFDAGGTRVSSVLLAVSSPLSLVADEPGYNDAFDAFGQPSTSRRTTVYRRRWEVSLLTPADEDTLVLRSCVYAVGRGPTGDNPPPSACVSTIRTRKP
jgi:prepilin-type N-terminal cleavage/methylation domain-containing protein